MAAAAESRKSTRQKASILRCLCSMEGAHLTADELVDRLKRSGTPVSKATVYRLDRKSTRLNSSHGS